MISSKPNVFPKAYFLLLSHGGFGLQHVPLGETQTRTFSPEHYVLDLVQAPFSVVYMPSLLPFLQLESGDLSPLLLQWDSYSFPPVTPCW